MVNSPAPGKSNFLPNIKRRLTGSLSSPLMPRLRSNSPRERAKTETIDRKRNSVLGVCNWGEFKLLVLGAEGVGKTTICEKYVAHELDETERANHIYDTSIYISVDDCARQYDLELFVEDVEKIKKNIEDYKSLLIKCDGFLLMYSTLDYNSFMTLFEIVEDIKHFRHAQAPIVVMGHKSGLQNGTRKVTDDDIISFSQPHFEVDDQFDERVSKTFNTLVNMCIKLKDNEP